MRFGPTAANGLDAHVMGTRERAHRKLVPGGVRTVVARLRLGAHEAVLGVSASELTGRIVPLEDLWGDAATRRLYERAGGATPVDAAAALDAAIAERVTSAGARSERTQLALDAAHLLAGASVAEVARELGISERHLRRVFRQTLGVSPKAYAQLARFHRALRAARSDAPSSWARIAHEAGYYDQAHLSGEFRSIVGASPRAFLGELRAAL